MSDQSDPIAAWKALREVDASATVIDLYRLVAEPRGLEPHELPREERVALARAVMPLVWPGWQITDGSERRESIEIVDYDPHWPQRFRALQQDISAVLGSVARRIEHVGSTSVPGLPAKPRIDIQVSVAHMDDEAQYVPALERIGLQLRSRDSLHRYLRPFPGQLNDRHVHVCRSGSAWERDHLLFRDFLRAHADAAARYATVKREAVKRWADDGWAYTDAKSATNVSLLKQAEAWASEIGWHS